MDTITATDNYASMLQALPNLEPITLLSLFFLTLARVIPLVVLAPFFGAKNVPRVIRMMFSISLVAIFLPQNAMLIKQNIHMSTLFMGLFLKELLIGLLLGFFSTVPFYIAQMAGTLVDHQRGASSLQVTDPTTQTQTGPIGILFNYVMIAVFFTLGGPFLFLEGVASSYQVVPIDTFLNPTFFAANTPLIKSIMGLFQKMMDTSIQLAAPGLVGVLLTDMFLGIANRLAPQVQIVFLGISLKSWVGLALLTVAWAIIFKFMGKESIDWIKGINQMIQTFQFYKG